MGPSMRPFAVSESDASIAERVTDLTVLVDRVTQRPMTNGHLAPVGRDTDFGTRRNLEVGTHKTNAAVGLRLGWETKAPAEPLWLRLHEATADFGGVVARCKGGELFGGSIDGPAGRLFFPLKLPRGIGGPQLVALLNAQIDAVIVALVQPPGVDPEHTSAAVRPLRVTEPRPSPTPWS